ncbi:MAG: hypothetical protein JW934_05130, partial [Anaerolineae bacterium]|nr:hypothetical protein [Anaerolineae bacterium]
TRNTPSVPEKPVQIKSCPSPRLNVEVPKHLTKAFSFIRCFFIRIFLVNGDSHLSVTLRDQEQKKDILAHGGLVKPTFYYPIKCIV